MTRQILLTGTVSTVVTLSLAFLLFGRRRRDGEADDGELAMAAATAYGGPLAVAPAVMGAPGIDPGPAGRTSICRAGAGRRSWLPGSPTR